jgi:hypothetical protein
MEDDYIKDTRKHATKHVKNKIRGEIDPLERKRKKVPTLKKDLEPELCICCGLDPYCDVCNGDGVIYD